MTALRTTRSAPTLLAFLGGVVALLAVATGCGGPPPGGGDSDAARPLARELSPPSAERIGYNPDTRTLTLYHLPRAGSWIVQQPEDSVPVAVGPVHVLRETADPEATKISYRRPTGQVAGWVSVGDVLAARATNQSN